MSPTEPTAHPPRRFYNLLAAMAAALLVACVVAAYLTRDAGAPRGVPDQAQPGVQASIMDTRLLETAQQLASLAETDDEQALALKAIHFADHELDQAFAFALHSAASIPAPTSGPLKRLADNVSRLKAQVAIQQAEVTKLTQPAATSDAAADELDLAKAHLAVSKDDLEDAQQDLERQGGDPNATIQRALQEHEAAEHKADQQPKFGAPARTATLSQQIQAWFSLRDREHRLDAAGRHAGAAAVTLARDHDALEKSSVTQPGLDIRALRRLSNQKKALADQDTRIQDLKQLAGVYNQWRALVEIRRSGIVHLLLRSFAAVLAILLAMILIDRAIRRAFDRVADPRRIHQLRVIVIIAVQVIAILLILLIVFGPPNQMSTMIALLTAGITVVLRDYIVAFFGWFALMGKNGIRVGDWVEIAGVSGEVIEIGLMKTVLLEMGNWTNAGHPTGRRVAFVNSFAIESHYFNFSTAGQWLWDELQVTLPADADPYEVSKQIREIVERETEKEAAEAETEWERVTQKYGTQPFSAKPAVEFRTSARGLDVAVRYITRAPQRYQVKSRLFDAIIDLLHKSQAAGALKPAT